MQLSSPAIMSRSPPPLRSYVEKKLERLVRHFDHVIDVHCVLTVEKLQQQGRGHAARARRAPSMPMPIDDDMYAAIDALADKLDRRASSTRKSSTDHHAAEAQQERAP